MAPRRWRREIRAQNGCGGSARFVLLGLPLHAAAGPFGVDGVRLALLLDPFGALAIVLEDALARERALEPIQELRGRIDLIVVLALRKHRQLVAVFSEPNAAPPPAGSYLRSEPQNPLAALPFWAGESGAPELRAPDG